LGLRPVHCHSAHLGPYGPVRGRWSAIGAAALPFRASSPVRICKTLVAMHLFDLTRKLIDIESITPNEGEVGDFLFGYMSAMAEQYQGQVERMPAEPGRDNIFVRFGNAVVTLTTHMDTVPPFIASSDDGESIWGRGACDTKGIIASMIIAAHNLLKSGQRNFALLFVVGEERNSVGAYAAAKVNRGSRFLINGEPTENKLAIASKGALRYEIVAKGRMAHSAYPALGESAILKLLDALERIRRLRLPEDDLLGPSTMNIGLISGGRAPNVIPDEAKAEIFIRVVGPVLDLCNEIEIAACPDADAKEVLFIPALRLGTLPDFETTVVAFTTDIPAFDGAWGRPFLIGPGTIRVAHTADEHIPKSQLLEAVAIYERMVRQLTE
jgi:acetylornithine deacetylase